MAHGFLMGVMSISFALLPIELYKSLWKSEVGKWLVYKDFNLKDTKLIVQSPWPSRTLSTVFICSISNLVFLTCSFVSAKSEHYFTSIQSFGRSSNDLFVLFPQELFLCDAGLSDQSSVLELEINCPLHLFKKLSSLDKILQLNWYLKSVYRQSTCWKVNQNASSFCSNSLMSPSSTMWYLQLGR